ncbi:class I tRNA ligase family protein [Patescibacteria group bacterium]|nr:class I tRNA ligase family protein [Patescibacteria group bacterium]
MSAKRFFITTPIYYPNDVPHVGHAYSSFIADVYARFHRMLGYEVKFST